MATLADDLIGNLLNAGGLVGNAFAQGRQNQLDEQQGQQLIQYRGLQMQAAQRAQQQAQQYQADVAAYSARPTPQALASLMAKYPEQADAIKKGYDVLDAPARESRLSHLFSLYNAADNGRADLASGQIDSIISAEKAAGLDTTDAEAMKAALSSGDAAAQKQALDQLKAFAQAHLAIADPKFAEQIGLGKDGAYTLEAGATRFDRNGNIIARSPYLKGPDGELYERDDAKGGGPASGGGGASPGAPFDPHRFFKEFVLPHEGGYAAHDANGAPVNMGVNQAANPGVDVKNLTPDQAAEIFATKYAAKAASLPAPLAAAYADTAYINPKRADQFLKASGGDPGKFMTLRENWMASLVAKDPGKYGPYERAWTNRNRDLRAYVSGQVGTAPQAGDAPPGYHLATPGKPKATVLSPAEASSLGLDTSKIYQRHADGTVSAVGDAPGKGGVSAPGNPELSGPEYIADLGRTNRALANQVQAVLDTRSAYPPATARSPQAQILRAAVLQADPSFDELAYKRRKDTIAQYTPGHAGPGASMLSAATLINHIYELAQAARELPDHSLKLMNSLSAFGASQTNQPWLIKYNEGRKYVASELPKFLEGKAPTEGQVKEHYDSYSPAKGKSGIHEALATDMDYLYGRYQPLIQAYKDATGKDLNIDNYAPGQATRAKAAALEYYRNNGALPTVVSSQQQAAKLPHGAIFVTPDGRVLRRR